MTDTVEMKVPRVSILNFRSENEDLYDDNNNLNLNTKPQCQAPNININSEKSLDRVYVVRHGYGMSNIRSFRDFKKARQFTLDCVDKYLSGPYHSRLDKIPKFRNEVSELDGFKGGIKGEVKEISISFQDECGDPKDTGFVFSEVMLE